MIRELLILGRGMPHQGAVCQHQVRSGIIKRLVNQEILLLPSQGGNNLFYILVKQMTHLHGSLVKYGKRTEQRGLVVKRLTGV